MPVRRVFWILMLLLPLLFLDCNTGSFYPRIVIDTFTATSATESNTYLTLIDNAGNVIAEDDDGNPDQVNQTSCSRIDYQGGLSGGTYYIKVHHPLGPATSLYYGIRVLDFDPGASFPGFTGVNENDGGSDDAVDGNGVPINPEPISLGQVVDDRAIYPEATDVDWFVLVLP